MAVRGEDEQAEAVGALGTVWPPPPTGPAPLLPTPRSPIWLIHLPLSPLLTEFSLPKWTKAALGCLFIAFVVLLMGRDSPLGGKVIVGLFVALDSLLLSTLLFWGISALRLRQGRYWQPPQSFNKTAWKTILQSLGGWMGLVPVLVFWAWGLFYLADGHDHLINRVALAVWGSWFLLGCLVAVVNGAGQWFRDRRASRGVEP